MNLKSRSGDSGHGRTPDGACDDDRLWSGNLPPNHHSLWESVAAGPVEILVDRVVVLVANRCDVANLDAKCDVRHLFRENGGETIVRGLLPPLPVSHRGNPNVF